MRNILVLAPHSDDAEIGIGGLIHRSILEGDNVHVLVIITQDTYHANNQLIFGAERSRELKESMAILGVDNWSILYKDKPQDYDLLNSSKVQTIAHIDQYIKEHKIDTVYMPTPSFHQEHQYTYECGIASTRPTLGGSIKYVYAYEYPGSVWTPNGTLQGGKFYINIDIALKLKALTAHKSQRLDEHKLVSTHSVKALAILRGYESGLPYAELVYLLRGVM